MKKKYYVYMHLYNNRPVYIGKGSINKYGYDDRVIAFNKRSEKYKEFINSIGGKQNIETRIVARFDDEQDALWLEEELHKVHEDLFSTISKGKTHPMYGKFDELNPNSKSVICLNTEEIFNSLTTGAKKYNIKSISKITLCCKGKRKSAGKHPITKEKLKWMYYRDYTKLNDENLEVA